MLLLDDLVLGPGKFVLWIVRQVHDAAEQEMAEAGERVAEELRDLHRRLETGAITESEFESRETELLDRLDAIQAEREHEVLDAERE